MIPFSGHSQNVDLLAFSPAKDVLVSAGTDRKTYLWLLNAKKKKKTKLTEDDVKKKSLDLDSSTDAVSCLDWASDGLHVAAGTEHGHVLLWRSDGSRVASWHPHQMATKSVKMSDDGQFVLSVADIVCIYSRRNKTWLRTAWNEAAFTDAEWISAYKFITADVDGVITMDTMKESHFTDLTFAFDLPLDVPSHQFRGHSGGVYRVLRHPGRKDVFASCSVDCTVIVWKVEKTKPQHVLEGHFGYVTDLAWIDEDDDLLASASYDGSVRVWDTKRGDCLFVLEDHRERVTQVAVNARMGYIASSAHDGKVNFWSLRSGKLVNSYEGPGRMLRANFDCDGEFLAVSSYGAVQILALKYNTN